MKTSKEVVSLIIGSGFLGQKLLNMLLGKGETVWVSTRNEIRAEEMQSCGARTILVDVNEADTWAGLDVLAGIDMQIYLLLPPSKLRLEIFRHFLSHLQRWPLKRLVMTSSTVVYGRECRTVDADSTVRIDSDRAKRQFDLEEAVRSMSCETRIVRLAGLYGAERIIGIQTVLAKEKLSGRAASYLNLIHVEDAATLLLKVMSSQSAARVELGSDGQCLSRGQYYGELARVLACPPPVFEDESDSPEGRRCDNAITCERVDWQPHYTDFKQVLKQTQ
ncbi:MAG: hypothetical protein GKR93_06795 [Gammaproteobacteria bacterium]|nr:hypothetical protein [Gammaproteobacteria bacterium]